MTMPIDAAFVSMDRSEPLVVVPFHFAIEIAKAAENSRMSVSKRTGALYLRQRAKEPF